MNEKYNHTADIYSFGMVVLNMLSFRQGGLVACVSVDSPTANVTSRIHEIVLRFGIGEIR